MSTYYYLLCNDCKEKVDAASRAAGGICHLGNSEKMLLPFIVAHSDHNIVIVSEHSIELYDPDYKYREWTEQDEMGI